jgi:chaperonin cofactor prefoldin
MNHRTLALLGAVAIAAFFSTTARAQSTPQDTPAQPAPAATAPSVSSTSPAPAAQPPAKKVWTNDDVSDLRGSSPISTVGNAKSGSGKPGAKSASSAHTKEARSYHDQIARLQAQLPPIDQKISELQAALSGKQVSEDRHFGGVRPDDWKDELARLQKQHDDIATKIATLEDQARHAGAPTNQIP